MGYGRSRTPETSPDEASNDYRSVDCCLHCMGDFGGGHNSGFKITRSPQRQPNRNRRDPDGRSTSGRRVSTIQWTFGLTILLNGMPRGNSWITRVLLQRILV